jgi:hypothetical protein
MNKASQPAAVKVRDRVTFDSDEGVQTGYVNEMRRDLGNGELHAWVELEHKWPGCFRAVAIADILSSHQVGPPSAMYFGFEPAKHASEFTRLHLCNFDANEKSESASQ